MSVETFLIWGTRLTRDLLYCTGYLRNCNFVLIKKWANSRFGDATNKHFHVLHVRESVSVMRNNLHHSDQFKSTPCVAHWLNRTAHFDKPCLYHPLIHPHVITFCPIRLSTWCPCKRYPSFVLLANVQYMYVHVYEMSLL